MTKHHPLRSPRPVACQRGTGQLTDYTGDAIVLGLHDEWKDSSVVGEMDNRVGGLLSRLLQQEEISTKPNKIGQFLAPNGLSVRCLMTVGLGPSGKSDTGTLYRAAATAAKALAASKLRKNIAYGGFTGESQAMEAAVMGSLIAGEGQDLFTTEPSLNPAESVAWFVNGELDWNRCVEVARSVNLAKRLVNLPPNYLYPQTFVDMAQEELSGTGVEVVVWDELKLADENCNALLAVARGSVRPPRLCVFHYRGTDSTKSPIALVGKGVTFDSGGYSLKPTDGMLTMKCDMAGAATVLAIVKAAAKLKFAQPIIGAVGLVENLVSGDAFKLGDVIQSRSGKTIEIHNTDAEGRLVLADVLNVVLDHRPSKIIDFATLTGACVVALGNDVVGMMTNKDDWQRAVQEAANKAGEYVWPLPMFSFFNEQIRSKVADIKNVGEGRWGGAITAAKFLEEFVGDTPWLHLDIAGPAFLDSPKPWADAGGTGVMVRSIVELLQEAKVA